MASAVNVLSVAVPRNSSAHITPPAGCSRVGLMVTVVSSSVPLKTSSGVLAATVPSIGAPTTASVPVTLVMVWSATPSGVCGASWMFSAA